MAKLIPAMHAICAPCLIAQHPGTIPVGVPDPATEVCCWCGSDTDHGIYLGRQPQDVPCHGSHKDKAATQTQTKRRRRAPWGAFPP
jgi:hypothetical protein